MAESFKSCLRNGGVSVCIVSCPLSLPSTYPSHRQRGGGYEKAKVGNRRNDMGIVVRLGSASGILEGRLLDTQGKEKEKEGMGPI